MAKAKQTMSTAYDLGFNLSIALLGSARGANGSAFLAKAQANAGALGVKLPPFPKNTGDKAKDTATAFHYLLSDVKPLGVSLPPKLGLAFEVGIKSNMMRLLYSPGDDHQLAQILDARCTRMGMPKTTCAGLAKAVAAKAPSKDVNALLDKLDLDMRAYAAKH